MATDDTGEAILTVARAILVEDGYAGLSVQRVADAAAVTESDVVTRFESTAELALSVLDAENASLLHRQAWMYAEDVPLSVQWRKACDFLDEDVASGYVRIFHELLAAGLSDAVIADRVAAILDGWRVVLTVAAQRQVERGLAFGPFDVDQVVALTASAFLGAERLVLAGVESKFALRDALRAFADVIEAGERAIPERDEP